MKKLLLLCGALLALTATAATAQQAFLAWDDCIGPASKVFACDTNAGADVAYSSFALAVPMTAFVGTTAFLSVKVPGATPAYWQGAGGQCRAGLYTGENAALAAPGACADGIGASSYLAASNYVTDGNGPGDSSIESDLGHDPATQLAAGTRYYAQEHQFKHLKTVGATVCAGCSTPVCITLVRLLVAQTAGTPGGDQTITPASPQGSITYQGGDCIGTAARNTTWGSLKNLYR